MPIFHFDIADGVRLEDPVGLDCRNETEARKTADLIARQIAIDLDDGNSDRCVVVVDEAGSEIYTAQIKDWLAQSATYLPTAPAGAINISPPPTPRCSICRVARRA